MNKCILVSSNDVGFKRCLRCHFNGLILPGMITLEKSCTPIPDNLCVDLYFNTTALFQNFFQHYSDLINQLFIHQQSKHAGLLNSLYIHIEYDTLEKFSLDTFRLLDQTRNRTYHTLSFELKNRDNRVTLPLDENIVNMTLSVLQINIYCGSKGLYQYNYVSNEPQQESIPNSLRCEIPTTATISMNSTMITTTTTVKNRSRMIVIFGFIGGGSLIPCFILVCFLFILCKQNYEKKASDNQRRESLTSTTSSADSLFSEQS